MISYRKSSGYVVIVYVVAMIIIGLAFSVLMQPLGVVYDSSSTHEAVQDDVYQQFFTRSRTIFVWLPLLIGLPLIIWILLESHNKITYR